MVKESAMSLWRLEGGALNSNPSLPVTSEAIQLLTLRRDAPNQTNI